MVVEYIYQSNGKVYFQVRAAACYQSDSNVFQTNLNQHAIVSCRLCCTVFFWISQTLRVRSDNWTLLQGRFLCKTLELYGDEADANNQEYFLLDFAIDFKPTEVLALAEVLLIPVCSSFPCCDVDCLLTAQQEVHLLYTSSQKRRSFSLGMEEL